MADPLKFLPGELPIEGYQGDDHVIPLAFADENTNPIDLTSFTFECHILDTIADDSQSLPVELSCVVTDGPNGLVDLTLSSSKSAPLNGSYVYDVQGTGPNGTRTYLKGTITFDGEVTR